MKKAVISLVAGALLAAIFAACGQNNEVPQEFATGEITTTATAEQQSGADEESSVSPAAAQVSFSDGETALQSVSGGTQAATPSAISVANTVQQTASASSAASTGATITTTRRSTTNAPKPVTTTATARTTTSTAPRLSTTTTTAPTTTRTMPDYESMGQALYQTKVIEALNAMRADRGLAPMVKNAALMSSSLAQAQKMAVAGRSYHTEGIPPGFESVAHVPIDFPAQLLGEMLTNHVVNFLQDGYDNVGIAVVRNGNQLYACMQGN